MKRGAMKMNPLKLGPDAMANTRNPRTGSESNTKKTKNKKIHNECGGTVRSARAD